MLFGILLSFSRGSSKHPSHFSGMETWRPQAVKKLEVRIPLNPKQYSGRKCGFVLYSEPQSGFSIGGECGQHSCCFH